MINHNTISQNLFSTRINPSPLYVTTGERIVNVDDRSGGNTIQLATADMLKQNHVVTVKDVSGTLNNNNFILIQPEGAELPAVTDYIDGWNLPIRLNVAYGEMTFMSTYSEVLARNEWKVISSSQQFIMKASSPNPQIPDNLNVPKIIEFGADVGSSGQPVDYGVTNNNAFTFNQGGYYENNLIFNVFRPSGSGFEILQIHAFKNGVAIGDIVGAVSTTQNEIYTLNVQIKDSFVIGDYLSYQMVCSQTDGAIDIGLLPLTTSIPGWNSAGSAICTICKL